MLQPPPLSSSATSAHPACAGRPKLVLPGQGKRTATPSEAGQTSHGFCLGLVTGALASVVTRKVRTQLRAESGWRGVDARYNPQWLKIEERVLEDLQWAHVQTFWAVAAVGLWTFEVYRFLHLLPPTNWEVCVAGLIYAGLYASRYTEVEQLPQHYRVTFYASCGWAFYSYSSLVHVMAASTAGVGPAEAFHAAGCAVFLGSCFYFYTYHWGRMFRHWCENRFRPWFAFGIAGLTAVHLLSVGHIYRVLDDPRWWPTIAVIYPDEWHFVADIRLAELFLTAAALFLVICHLRGVLTGSKNAAVVFAGTVFLPAAALVFESWFLKASAWQHYLMNGPKHW